ncbi:unnamed protein product [Durusdinium trenchii]|uniref:Uncharacterized protein n=1 Tax=Durusdinium trenchii TaxID=1381693 RepID=A0ABP0PQ64_9DINO
MGNFAGGGPPADEEQQKAAFRACLQKNCVPQVQNVLQLRSSNQLGTKFQVVSTGKAETRPDPRNSNLARQTAEADERLLECEQQCAQRCWPDALTKPWLGTVAVDMAGVLEDQVKGARGNFGRFS